MHPRFLFLIAAVFAASVAQAELEWKTRHLRLEPPAGATDVRGTFEFVNRGASPVRIVDVRSTCGCTVTAPESEEVLPGATGRIQADFHLGDRRGVQSVLIAVLTADPAPKSYELALEVDIKEFVTLSPRLVYWRIGEATTTKAVQLTLAEGFQLVGVRSTSDHFTAELVTEPGPTKLHLTPRDTAERQTEAVVITVAGREGQPIESRVILRVL